MRLYDAKLEMLVVKSICESDKRYQNKLLAQVTKEHFHHDPTREAIERIFSIVRRDGEIPTYAEVCSDPVLSETNRKLLRKSEAVPIADEKLSRKALKVLHKYYQARNMYFLSENINKSLQEDKVDVDKLLETTADSLAKVRTRADHQTQIFHIGKGNNSAGIVKRILNGDKPNLVPTGFKAFDEKNGGIAYGSLFVLGGSTGGGKTSLALQIAQNMAKLGRESVAYVPLEMNEDETMERLTANISKTPLSKIKQKKCTDEEKKKIVKSYKAFMDDLKEDDLRLTIFAPYEDITYDEALLMLKPYGFKVIIIDYISLLKNVGGDDAWQKLGDVARACKVWAKNNNTIVILLAQVNAEGEVRYSGAIKEHANNAWFWVATKETRDNKVMDIRQLKARNQLLFNFQLGYDDDLYTVFDLDNPNVTDVRPDEDEEADSEYLGDVGDDDG